MSTTTALGARAASRKAPWWGSRPAWLLLAAVAAVALAIGSAHGDPHSPTARAAALDTLIKCPSCEDLSIAQSSAPSAVTLRHEVRQFVLDGWSDARIESWVTDRYGPSALLLPQSGGIAATLYLVPAGVVGAGVIGLGWYFWRRRSPSASAATQARRHGAAS